MDVMIVLKAIESGAIRDNRLVDLVMEDDTTDKRELQEALGLVEVIVGRILEKHKDE